MSSSISRRRFFVAAPGLAVAPCVAACGAASCIGDDDSTAADSRPVPASFPSQDPALVKEIVRVSHFDARRVRDLVSASPALANAAWDWGFGDWETALGAASHMGNREIAGILIEHGARPDIFTAAMLGNLDAVQSMIESSPGMQRHTGPHGITLLKHARAGGDPASAVVVYLESLGDADPQPRIVEMTAEERRAYLGTYVYGERDDERFEIIEKRNMLGFLRGEGPHRPLFNLGGHEFHPSGAAEVRLRFAFENGRAVRVSVHDPDPIVIAQRWPGS